LDEILRDVERLREEWAQSVASAEDVVVEPAPAQPAAGTDGTGTVHVAVDAAGVPESITLDEGWRRQVGTERLVAAVVEANVSAAAARVAGMMAGTPGTEIPPDLADQVREFLATDPPFALATGTGTAARGNLVVTVSEVGLRSITVEPEWLARRDDAELTESLATALTAARAELAEALARRDRE